MGAMPSPVLVVSTDPLLGALLGAMIELSGDRPVFHEGFDSLQAAVDAHRPRVILIDVDHPDGTSIEFMRRQWRAGIAVVLYGPRERAEDALHVVGPSSSSWLGLPIGYDTLARTIAGATVPKDEP
jgi:DNA-binding NtrC family response regulator